MADTDPRPLEEDTDPRLAQIHHLQEQVSQLMSALQTPQPPPHPSVSGSLSMHVKPPKPETFQGTSKGPDVVQWIFEMEQYLTLTHTSAAMTVNLAAAYLRGPAGVWWRTRQSTLARPLTWPEFTTELRNQFLPVSHSLIARDKLANLKQTGSVQDYIYRFQSLCAQITDMHVAEKRDKFVRGLKYAIMKEVTLRPVDSFEEMVALAGKTDALEFRCRKLSNQAWPSQASSSSSLSEPTPMELGAVSHQKGQPSKSPPQTVHRPTPKLDEETRERLRKEGICFYCKEKGHIAFHCPKKSLNKKKQ
jgi:Retrotransposon gag protein